MGCGNSTTREEKINAESFPVLHQIQKLIEENPLYYKDFDDIEEILEKNKTEDFLKIYEKIHIYFKFDKIITEILKDVLTFASKRLKYVFPKGELNKHMFSILFFFLSNGSSKDIVNAKYKYLKNLLNYSKKEDTQYYSSKLSNIITNSVQFCLFTFVYLFASRAILIKINDFPIEGLEQIYINKSSFRGVQPEEFTSYVNNQVNSLCYGRGDYHKVIVQILLSNIFQPISHIITENPNLEIATITNEQFDKIIKNLGNIIDANGIFNHIFYIRLHSV